MFASFFQCGPQPPGCRAGAPGTLPVLGLQSGRAACKARAALPIPVSGARLKLSDKFRKQREYENMFLSNGDVKRESQRQRLFPPLSAYSTGRGHRCGGKRTPFFRPNASDSPRVSRDGRKRTAARRGQPRELLSGLSWLS